MYPVFGELLDVFADDFNGYYRIDNGQQFTLRMFPVNGVFEWTYETDRTDWGCLNVEESFAATEFLQYMQVAFTATTANCRTDLKLFSTTTTPATEINLHVVVWPESTPAPPVEGLLVELDTATTNSLAVRGGSSITVRVTEWATPTGYKFVELVNAEFNCLTLENRNLGDFNTGYKQYHFVAKDEELLCEEVLSLAFSEHADAPGTTFDIDLTVEKAACSAIECPAGETVNAFDCSCMTEPAV